VQIINSYYIISNFVLFIFILSQLKREIKLPNELNFDCSAVLNVQRQTCSKYDWFVT